MIYLVGLAFDSVSDLALRHTLTLVSVLADNA